MLPTCSESHPLSAGIRQLWHLPLQSREAGKLFHEEECASCPKCGTVLLLRIHCCEELVKDGLRHVHGGAANISDPIIFQTKGLEQRGAVVIL